MERLSFSCINHNCNSIEAALNHKSKKLHIYYYCFLFMYLCISIYVVIFFIFINIEIYNQTENIIESLYYLIENSIKQELLLEVEGQAI